ncbi:MAG: SgcJ/EcaC family oxidoreductase [Bacteroidetes bacterium]|nr:SgcJ/EcaC family oxidoreductase [Bacteroidota bacterium]
MKTTFISFLLLFTLSLFSQSASAQTDNQATFETYLKTVYTAFENSSGSAMHQFYAPDATEIGPDGRITSGLKAIEASWLEFEKMMDIKPKFTYKLTSWRLVKPDLAIITWDSEDEFQMQGQKIVGKNSSSAVLRKEKGNWLIEHDQLTPKMDFQMPDQQADIAAIKALGNEAYAAFEARDAARFAACYTEDVDFISPFGMAIKGRKAVEQVHAELFKAWANMPESKVEIGKMNIRFITPDVAVCQWGHKETMTMNGNPVTEESTFVNACQKVDGKWLVAALSLTPVRPMPQMAGN